MLTFSTTYTSSLSQCTFCSPLLLLLLLLLFIYSTCCSARLHIFKRASSGAIFRGQVALGYFSFSLAQPSQGDGSKRIRDSNIGDKLSEGASSICEKRRNLPDLGPTVETPVNYEFPWCFSIRSGFRIPRSHLSDEMTSKGTLLLYEPLRNVGSGRP